MLDAAVVGRGFGAGFKGVIIRIHKGLKLIVVLRLHVLLAVLVLIFIIPVGEGADSLSQSILIGLLE